MADANLITQADLKAQSIDFVEQFQDNVNKLLQILGVTRKIPMQVGSTIKVYKTTKTLADGTVGEGETIPLSKVTRKEDHTETLAFKKYRKQTTAEAIQSAGFDNAVNYTDTQLLQEVQKNIKKDLVTELVSGKSATNATGANFKLALAHALGQLAVKWEDDDITSVAFVNPLDFYDYLGNADITVQNAFGLQYIQNFLGVNVIILSAVVPQGKIAVTAADNIIFAYAPVSGQLGVFNLVSDQTGFIGVSHEVKQDNATYVTMAMLANVLFAERLDGIVLATIDAGSDPKAGKGN